MCFLCLYKQLCSPLYLPKGTSIYVHVYMYRVTATRIFIKMKNQVGMVVQKVHK